MLFCGCNTGIFYLTLISPSRCVLSSHSIFKRQLSLNRSVFSHRIAFSNEPERTLGNAFTILKDREGFKPGDRVVVVSDIIAGMGIEAIQVRNIPEVVEASDA